MPKSMTEGIHTTQEGHSKCPSFVNNGHEMPPTLPTSLPESMVCILQSTPDLAKPAVAMAVFSALRVLLSEVQFRYVDNSLQEPCFMNLCIAQQASGKSAIRPPLNEIIYDVQKQDMASREMFEQWREKVATMGANKQRPAEPNAPIRIVQADMTNPALVKLAKRANPQSLWTYGEELEKLYRLKGASEVIRSAYDTEIYGQERVGAGSVCDVVRLRWSFNFSTTPGTARRMLKNDIGNGTLTRLCLSTIIHDENDWGEKEIPMFGEFGEPYRTAVAAYSNYLLQAKGIIDCEEAKQWAMKEKQKQIDRLKMMDAKAMLPFLWRSLQMGFWRACFLYIMHGMHWSDEIEEFASWSVDYDMWCKIFYFGDMIEAQDESNNTAIMHRPTMLLPHLPDQFTREQAMEMRRLLGKSTTQKALKNMLGQWVHRGFIIFDNEKQVYTKTAECSIAVAKTIPHTRAPAE